LNEDGPKSKCINLNIFVVYLHIDISRVYLRIMTTTRFPWKKRIVESTRRNNW